MGIRPKFQLGKKERNYIATKQFTNREFPREVFDKHVDRILHRSYSDVQHDVIMYYGIGGIGKSSLQRQLQIELLNQVPDALYTSVDFMDPVLQSPSRALLELAKEIKYRKKIPFPHFEIAYSLYFCKRNPDLVFNEKQVPFKSEMDIVSNVMSALDGFGLVGAVTGVIDKLYETKKKWGLNKDVRDQLKELETCSLQEIESRLPAFFAFDLQEAISKQKIPMSVIFIDTYEALWVGVKNEATKYTKDEWVRELVASLPNVLFVICGREYLEWEVIDPHWGEIVDQHILGNLSENDAELFLRTCGIEEKDIRLKMIKASDGHPYHLDLSVDTYFEMKNRGETTHPSLFGSNKREILDRFLRYLSDEEIETLKIMSIPRFYNKDVFLYALSTFSKGYLVTRFDDFNKFSFIIEEGQNYYIHALMRESMLNYTSSELIKDIHTLMATYYSNMLEDQISLVANNEKEILVLEENLFHKKNTVTAIAFADWLRTDRIDYLKKLQLRGEGRFLLNLLNTTYDELGPEKMHISLFSIFVDMIHLSGKYETAVTYIKDYHKEVPMKAIINSKEELHLLIRKFHHQMFYSPIKPLIQELLNLEPMIPREYEDEYNEVLFMLGGNLGVLNGDLRFSRKWLVKSIRFAQKTGKVNYLCRALRKYADVLRLKGHYKWAKICVEQGIQIARENGYERYESYLLCTLGDILRLERDYEQADQLFEQANLIIKRHGIRGWEGHINSARAEMAFQQGHYAEAAKYYRYANKIYSQVNQQWGIITSALGLIRCKLYNQEIDCTYEIQEIIERSEHLHYERECALAKEIVGTRRSESVPLIFL